MHAALEQCLLAVHSQPASYRPNNISPSLSTKDLSATYCQVICLRPSSTCLNRGVEQEPRPVLPVGPCRTPSPGLEAERMSRGQTSVNVGVRVLATSKTLFKKLPDFHFKTEPTKTSISFRARY